MVQKDVSDGLIPFWYGSTWGTTATCAYDQVDEIADVCAEFGLWLNLDAAYAGSSWVIPEYRKKVKGLEKIDSL
jgi:glutamate/tyrosine decarboxylase-like PLP-dependent enzyme